jgi:hypothetical protein
MIGGFVGMVLLNLLVMAGRREDSLGARELKNRENFLKGSIPPYNS